MGKIQIFTGKGHGKTPAALGEALVAAAKGEHVVVIQFLKGHGLENIYFQKRLEPEIKLFRFEKSDCDFMQLPEEKKRDEIRNIRNGLNFAKKVLSTGECDLLILDEVLGLVDNGIISEEDLKGVLRAQQDETDVVLTGISMSEEMCRLADTVSCIECRK